MDVEFARFSEAEKKHVTTIIRRASEKGILQATKLDLEMDLAATHYTCPLDLEALAGTDDFNFIHDVGGIQNHLDRNTGNLMNCFLPRFAKPENA